MFQLNKNKKWRCVLCMALFFISMYTYSQQSYFQQEVNHQIDVRLNDQQHSLSAFSRIQYIKNCSYKKQPNQSVHNFYSC
jgi:hypothetical protein